MSALALVLCAAAWLAQEPARVLVAASANAREKPAADARVACQVTMGQELAVEGREGDWVRVAECGQTAYVHASLVRPFTTATRASVREAMVRERLAREADGFAAADALLRLVEWWGREVEGNREARARYALYELKAFRNASMASHTAGGFGSALMHRIGETSPMVAWNEPGGSWILRDDYVWKIHDEYKDTAAADDIAWFVTENGLGGECEGYMPCYLSRTDRLEGEYLRRRPRGGHVDAALARVIEVAESAGNPPRLDFSGAPKSEVCKDLGEAMSPLRKTVAAAQSPRRAAALEALDRLSTTCR